MSHGHPPFNAVDQDGSRAATPLDGCGLFSGAAAGSGDDSASHGTRVGRRAFLAAAGATAAAGAVAAFPGRARADDEAHAGGDLPAVAGKPPDRARTLVLEPSWTLAYVDDDVELLRDHSVVVRDGVIADIVSGRVRGSNTRVPMHGQLLIPGMISGHTHVAGGTSTRGIIESGLPERFFTRALELTEHLDDDDLDALTAHNLAEILRGGCTTQLEQSLDLRQAKSYVRVARNWGVRGYPGGMTPAWFRTDAIRRRASDEVLFDSVPETLAEIQANLEFGLSVNGAEGGRILPQPAPHGPETQTPETLQATYEAAVQLGNGIHTHLATVAGDSANVERLWGKGPVTWVDDFGWYDVPFFGAHMGGWNVEVDAPFLAGKENFTYAHCPSGAGAGAGGGTQPFIEALGSGINTNVGLDTHSNDLLENAKLALLYGRLRYRLIGDTIPVPVKSPTVWDMIKAVTLNPANGLGRSDLGRIAVGAKADLTSIDVSGLLVGSGAPPPEPLNNLLYAHGLSVRNVMTEGVWQIWNGSLVVDNERRVIRRGAEVVQRIWTQLEVEGWFTPTPR